MDALSLTIPMILAMIGALLFTGVVAGMLAGLLGVGGGIVVVPAFFWLLEVLNLPASTAMHVAVATSLCTMIPTSIASMRAHNKRGSVDREMLRLWALGIVLGAASGGIVSGFIDTDAMKTVFGVMALLVAIHMLWPKQVASESRMPAAKSFHYSISYLIGGLSALMGIGGGAFSVTIMTLFNVPMLKAVGTSSVMGFLIAVPGVIGFIWAGWGVPDRPPYSLGYVSIPAALIIIPMTVLFAPLGAKLAHRMKARPLRVVFACFLGITALRMLYSVFFH